MFLVVFDVIMFFWFGLYIIRGLVSISFWDSWSVILSRGRIGGEMIKISGF